MPLPRARKSLGQHFLTDPRILDRIAAALDPAPGDLVVEIGAGTGTLTRVLAARVGKVIAIEKDGRLARDCGLRIADSGLSNVQIVNADALTLDWSVFNPQSPIRNPQFKVCGNIPYNITSPLLERVVALVPRPVCVVFMVQAEVADRLGAPAGSKAYGGLSVGIQSLCVVEKLFVVRAGAFTPPPRVHSAVIRLRPRPTPLVDPTEIAPFRTFVTACFSRRRKQLHNIVRAIRGGDGSAAGLDEGLKSLGLDPAARPETLAPEAFVRLWRWVLALGGAIVK
ncbi:MAG TPA: 16S rRNA (adenine(1518)-N(6)/adenine(1519)-N(6))-dimethyltransferase RsmA [Gemmatimonadales bacterium]